MDREAWTELLGETVEQTHCNATACRIGYRLHARHIDLEHLDATQDHPYGAHLVISIDTFQHTRRIDLVAKLVRWLGQVHPVPTVTLLA